MEQQNITPRFPEQNEPEKVHGTTDDRDQREKYLRDSGKIEDMPATDATPKMSSEVKTNEKNESTHLTDRSGEEEKEDYINTDERKRDIDRRH
jgi:hypothetical protein